jgi:hypothetical protein
MPEECVVDTTVLQKANAPITKPVARGSQFARRLAILRAILEGEIVALYSSRLVHEYEQHVKEPRNDFVRAFFELLDDVGRATYNWHRWTGAVRDKARKCRFPREDYHVLRTAIRGTPSAIITEEQRMVGTDACIYRELRVHVKGI